MANLDEAIFLRINGWVGSVPALDHMVGWLVSDYLVSTVLGFSLVVLWLAGGRTKKGNELAHVPLEFLVDLFLDLPTTFLYFSAIGFILVADRTVFVQLRNHASSRLLNQSYRLHQ